MFKEGKIASQHEKRRNEKKAKEKCYFLFLRLRNFLSSLWMFATIKKGKLFPFCPRDAAKEKAKSN